MIVISGALVLVALVLLVIGLISTALGFVYASIAVSVVSFVFLLLGILQRRGEPVPEAAGAGAPGTLSPAAGGDVEGVTAIIPGGRARSGADQPADAPEAVAAAPVGEDSAPEVLSGPVLVVAGRPRYHVSGCRYLTGKDAQEVPVEQARAEGFSACGVCRPDAALRQAAPPAEAASASPAPSPEPVAEPVADPVEPPAPARRTARQAAATPRRAAGTAAGPAGRSAAQPPAKAPAKAPARKAAAKAAPVKKAAAKKAPAKKAGAAQQPPAEAAPAKKSAAKKSPAKKAPAKKAAAKKAPAKKAP